MTREQAIQSGNKFLLAAVTILFLMQQLALSVSERQRHINQLVGQASGLLQHEIRDRFNRLYRIQSPRFREPGDEGAEPSAEERQLTSEIASLQRSLLDVESSKIFRELKVPGTDLAFTEGDVRLFYPISLATGLFGLLFYRRRCLNARSPPGDATLPFWAAPLSLRDFSGSFWAWVLSNAAGFVLIGYVIHLFWRFSFRDEFFASPYVMVAASVALLVAIGQYLLAIWQVWRADTRGLFVSPEKK